MLRTIRTTLLLAFATALAAPPAGAGDAPDHLHFEQPGSVPLLAADYGLEPARAVLLTDSRLTPRRLEVREDETIRWRSISRQGSRIVFEREVARAMVCHSLVNFELTGDRLQSAPLHTGDTASFCRLRPGTYRYHVVRDVPSERPVAGAVQLSSRLEGLIVVRPAERPLATR